MGQLCSLQRRERERERGRGDALHVVVGVAERDPALGDALDGERVASDGERLLLAAAGPRPPVPLGDRLPHLCARAAREGQLL